MLRWLFMLVLLALPLDVYIVIPPHHPIAFLSQILVAETVLLLGIATILARAPGLDPISSLAWSDVVPLGLILAASLVSIVGAASRIDAASGSLRVAVCLGLYLVARAVRPTPGVRPLALTMLLLGGLAVIVLGPLSANPNIPDVVGIALNISRAAASSPSSEIISAEATFRTPGELAAYLILVAPLLMAYALRSPSRVERASFWLLTILGCWVLALTYSRGALIAFFLVCPIVFFLLCDRKIALLGVALTLLAAGSTLLFAGAQGGRSLTALFLGDPGYSPPFAAWRWALDVFAQHPLTGVGLDNLRYQPNAPYMDAAQTLRAVDAQNLYLNVLAELGLIGALAVFVALAGAVRRAWRGIRAESGWLDSSWNVGVLAGLIGLLLFGLVNPVLISGQITCLLCALVGLAGPLAGHARRIPRVTTTARSAADDTIIKRGFTHTPSTSHEARNPIDTGDRPRRLLGAPTRSVDPAQEPTLRLPTPGEDISHAATARVTAAGADRSARDTSEYETVILAAVRPRSRLDGSGARSARGAPTLRVARALFILVLLVNLAGLSGLWGIQALSVGSAASADLQQRLFRIQSLGSEATSLQPGVLRQFQTELSGAEDDVESLNGVIPFNGALDFGGQGAAHRALTLSKHALDAAQEAVGAAIILQPALQALAFSATHPQVSSVSSGQRLMTPEDVFTAQGHLDQAQAYWAATMAARRSLSEADLASLHSPQITALVRKLDAITPSVTNGIALASAVLDWTPSLMGMSAPSHVLLFDVDTDELRATGGFLGNYADLVMNGGALTSGIHLHDVYTLDCPNEVCPLRSVPDEFSWFKLAGSHFGLRDSNLNPDFPTAAGLAAQLYEAEGGAPVNLVVAITPAVVEGILRVLGPIRVPRFDVTVSADTMRSQIHYYHQNPQIARNLGISASALGTSISKVFDVLLSQELVATVGALSSSQQGALIKSLIDCFATKDIQIFANNTTVESRLEQIGAAGQILEPVAGDSVFLVDTNDGASYANADISESLTDDVTLDAKGGATHSMSVKYAFVNQPHAYVQAPEYQNLARVILPSAATMLSMTGPCTPVNASQVTHTVVACQLSLSRGASVAITFSWYMPSAVSAGPKPTYSLLVQRQAGATRAAHITVTPAAGMTLSARGSLGEMVGKTFVWEANPQTRDATLLLGVEA
jgi:O-antigen ligase